MNVPKALAGIRVVDFTWVRSGPWGTRWLATLGAEVIKIEWPPNIHGRAGGGTAGSASDLNGSGFFNDSNLNKVATTVSARSPKGLDLVKRLISVSDIVVENFSTGVLEEWGLGFQELRKLRPDIVYVSMAGFGHTGRHKLYNTMGPVAQALSGMTFLSGSPGAPPAGWGWSYLDDTGGLYATICALTGLRHRHETGEGQHIDLSQMIAGVPLNGPAILDVTVNGRASRRPGYPPGNRSVWPGTPVVNNYRGPTTAPHNAYRTLGQGHYDWCTIVCLSDEEWQGLVRAMGSPAWAQDTKFTAVSGRIEHQEEMDAHIEAWARVIEKYDVMRRCQAEGVRCMPVQSSQDRADNDPQLEHRGYLTNVDHPSLGTNRAQNAPFIMSESPGIVWRAGPLLGQHNREVFEGLLGLGHEELKQGYEDGTFWPKGLDIGEYPYLQESMLDGSVPLEPSPPAGDGVVSMAPASRLQSPQGPLKGLRVLELATEFGQWCGKMMADLGADVIKVEPPGGERTRTVGPFLNDIPNQDRSLSFWHYNTSKRSVTLDVETEDGRDLFRRLAETSDVLLETHRPGYMASLGLAYEDLSHANPGLVMCSLTPFGQTGPWRDYLTSDLVHLAAGGQMGCCGYDDETLPDSPIGGGGGQAGHIASHYAYIGILAALYYRSRTAKGQHIDAAVHSACALTTEGMMYAYLYKGEVVQRRTGRHASFEKTPENEFLCKDGLYINASLGGAGGFNANRLRDLAGWLETKGLAADLLDEKYQAPKALQEHAAHIREVILNAIKHLPRDDLYHAAQSRGITFGAIRAPDELVDDGHLNDRAFWNRVHHPELGRSFKYPGPAAIYNGSPWKISRRPPLIGEHNEEVLCGELGLGRTELAALAEAGAV